MDKQKLLEKMGTFGLNLYDAAVRDEGGVSEIRYQRCNNCNNSYSVAKAFTMTAVGMLQDEGKLSINDKVTDFFPKWNEGKHDSQWSNVTIENALCHETGFSDGYLDIDDDNVSGFLLEDRQTDYLSLVWEQKLAYTPGTHYAYSDTVYYLLSRIVTAASGETLDEYLRTRLTLPLRFGSIAWSRCPQGYPIGGTGLYINARDMVKLGWMYLNGGIYNGEQIVSKMWADSAVEKGYELKPVFDTHLIGKGGLYGQMVLFSRESAVAVAWHGNSEVDSEKEMVKWLAEQI